MRDGWGKASLGELCQLEKGTSPTLKTPPGDYPLIVTGPEPLTSDSYQFEGEAVCVPMVSSTGHGHASLKRVHYATGKFAVANIVAACTVRDPNVVETKWLWFYLQHYKDDLIVPRMKGTANVSLSQQALSTVPVVLPPLDEQRRIVDLIGTIDEVIGAAEAARTALERFGGDLFPHLVGNDHDLLPMADLISHQIGGAWGKDPGMLDVDVTAFGTKAFVGARVLDPSSGQRRSVSAKQYHQRELRAGDLILEVSGGSPTQPVGRTLIVAEDMPHVIPSAFMRLLRFDPTRVLPQYAHAALRYLYSQGATVAYQTNTTTIRNLSVPKFLDHPIPVASMSAQKQVVSALASVDGVMDSYQLTQDSLRGLRERMLSSLLTGEHAIPESYDELIEEVA